MAAIPLLEETSGGGGSAAMIADLAGLVDSPIEAYQIEQLSSRKVPRRLSIYPAAAGFELVDELDFLCTRTVEPNIFFNARFLAPAMPRLEDREIRLAVIRDGDETRNRVRMLVPFSIDPPPARIGVSMLRSWSNPFGPLGVPLLDHDDPEGVMDDFLTMLARPHLKLPKVMAFPDVRLDGAFAAILHNIAETRGLPLQSLAHFERPALQSKLEGEDYLRKTLSSHHYREFRRLWRRLADKGSLEHFIARSPKDIRFAAESFLTLEASGWKGRERTAMAVDRFRAAFAREAIHKLAEQDMCRIHTLTLNGQAIASLVVFVEAGIAYTWKTAFDETYSAFSPGTLLMIEVTKLHLDDPNIEITDSCSVPDHPVMSRIWSERLNIGTLVVGLTTESDRATRQAASQIVFRRETRNLARLVRNRMRSLLGR